MKKRLPGPPPATLPCVDDFNFNFGNDAWPASKPKFTIREKVSIPKSEKTHRYRCCDLNVLCFRISPFLFRINREVQWRRFEPRSNRATFARIGTATVPFPLWVLCVCTKNTWHNCAIRPLLMIRLRFYAIAVGGYCVLSTAKADNGPFFFEIISR